MRIVIDTLGQESRKHEPFLIVDDVVAKMDGRTVVTGFTFCVKNEIVTISIEDAHKLGKFLL